MNELDTHARPSRTKAKQGLLREEAVRIDTSQCLVVSADQACREALAEAGSKAGWETVVCADAQNALAAVRRTRFSLVWIDLNYHGRTPAGFRQLCQTVTGMPNMLVIVSGHEADADEEIWARQLGVWLYLPGISPVHVDEFAELYEAAKQVAGGTVSRR